MLARQYEPEGQSVVQLVFRATVVDHLPAAHGTHVVAAALLYQPAEQFVHDSAPLLLNVPPGHVTAVALMDPGGQ